jgi:hypothetical protein
MRFAFPLLLVLLIAPPAPAQSADELYHRAARLYIDGADQEAEAAAEQGLRVAPNERRLTALLELIRREREEPPSQSQGDTEDDASGMPEDGSPEGSDAPPEPGDGSPGDAPPDGGPEPNAPGDDAPGGAPEPQTGSPSDAGAEGQPDTGDAQPGDQAAEHAPGGQMSREEAERILQALEADEQRLLQEVQRRRDRRQSHERDW